MKVRLPLVAITLMLLLPGCGGDLQTPGEALRIFGESLPQAFVGEQYSAPIRAVGGLRPFNFELREGKLPPGLRLQNGMIEGVATEVGVFEFTIVVSDANLSRTFNEYTLSVVERPPPRLLISAPQTEVRRPTTIRVRSENASELRAVSMLIAWDSESFELTQGSTDTSSGAAAFWRSEPGTLQVDMAALGTAWSDDRQLLSFELTPKHAAVPDLAIEAVFIDDRGGRHYQAPPYRAAERGAADGGTTSQGDSDEAGAAGNDAERNDDAADEDAGEEEQP